MGIVHDKLVMYYSDCTAVLLDLTWRGGEKNELNPNRRAYKIDHLSIEVYFRWCIANEFHYVYRFW